MMPSPLAAARRDSRRRDTELLLERTAEVGRVEEIEEAVHRPINGVVAQVVHLEADPADLVRRDGKRAGSRPCGKTLSTSPGSNQGSTLG